MGFSQTSERAFASEFITLGVHPYLSESELSKKFSPLANYLSHQIGIKVQVRVGGSYQEHIQFIGTDKIDIAYMGPASYINLTKQFGDKPILVRLEVNGFPYFQGNIITRADSGINSIKDLKGKRIAFGDPNSTMSYIVPHHMLHQENVFLDSRKSHSFLHSHNNVALSVLAGDFDAGAVKPAVFKKFEKRGLRTIALTPKISEHLFVTRANFPEAKIRAFRKAMLTMKDSAEGIKALVSIKKSITGLVKANSKDYENLRNIINDTKELHKIQ